MVSCGEAPDGLVSTYHGAISFGAGGLDPGARRTGTLFAIACSIGTGWRCLLVGTTQNGSVWNRLLRTLTKRQRLASGRLQCSS